MFQRTKNLTTMTLWTLFVDVFFLYLNYLFILFVDVVLTLVPQTMLFCVGHWPLLLFSFVVYFPFDLFSHSNEIYCQGAALYICSQVTFVVNFVVRDLYTERFNNFKFPLRYSVSYRTICFVPFVQWLHLE